MLQIQNLTRLVVMKNDHGCVTKKRWISVKAQENLFIKVVEFVILYWRRYYVFLM